MGQREKRDIEFTWCAWCGGKLEEDRSRAWCSHECRRLYWANHGGGSTRDQLARQRAIRAILTRGEEPAPTPIERRCRHCAKLFVPKEPRQRFCSKSCGMQTATRRVEVACLICASPFVALTPTAKYCSPACIAEGGRRSHRAARARQHSRAVAPAA